jgi:hypothetical protein
MVAGTKDLIPTGGSWRSSNPVLADGKPPNPEYSPTTQISGYQSKADGMVYIAADSFDRSQQVTMYRVDPERQRIEGYCERQIQYEWRLHLQRLEEGDTCG